MLPTIKRFLEKLHLEKLLIIARLQLYCELSTWRESSLPLLALVNIKLNDYIKCMQHAGWSPVTHHTTPAHRDWVTTCWSTGWDMNPRPWGLKPQVRPLSQWDSRPQIVCTFSFGKVFRYALLMSAASMSRSYSAAMRKASLILCLATMLEYIIAAGGSVIWPPFMKHALQVKSTFTSNTMWQGIHFDPMGARSPSFRIWKLG